MSVKTETEVEVSESESELELDIPSSQVLQRQMIKFLEPIPVVGTSQIPDSNTDGDDTLKHFFDLLYNMVKKFPPQLQTQVKIDLFKTVTEAELKLQCNMLDVTLNSNGN